MNLDWSLAGEPPGAASPLPRLVIANADFVTPRLALGGDLSPRFSLARKQLQELADAGITHIVDLRQEWSDENLVAWWHPEIRCLHHRVSDAGQSIPGSWFEELLGWVEQALREPDARVLVHCHMGVNRAPSAVFALLLADGWAVADALSTIRSTRPTAVIDYAQDALEWYLNHTGATPAERAMARESLSRWRADNDIDPEQVIRRLRSQEAAGSSWLVVVDDETTDAIADSVKNERPVLWLLVDNVPEQLAQLDEVLLWCRMPDGSGQGLVGIGLVVGPITERVEAGEPWLPVLLRAFHPGGLLPADQWPEADSELGPTPSLLVLSPPSLLAALERPS